MGRIVKVVAFALALGMATLPMSAAIVCLTHSSASHGSQSGCTGMQMHLMSTEAPSVSMAGVRPCCQMSQAPPLLKSAETKDNLRRTVHVDQLLALANTNRAESLNRATFQSAVSPPCLSSQKQTLLCVFLI